MKREKIPKYLQLGYVDGCIEQTLLWMNGVSEHRNDECTIDFSCCHPDLLSSNERRQDVGNAKLSELHERRSIIINTKI